MRLVIYCNKKQEHASKTCGIDASFDIKGISESYTALKLF